MFGSQSVYVIARWVFLLSCLYNAYFFFANIVLPCLSGGKIIQSLENGTGVNFSINFCLILSLTLFTLLVSPLSLSLHYNQLPLNTLWKKSLRQKYLFHMSYLCIMVFVSIKWNGNNSSKKHLNHYGYFF